MKLQFSKHCNKCGGGVRENCQFTSKLPSLFALLLVEPPQQASARLATSVPIFTTWTHEWLRDEKTTTVCDWKNISLFHVRPAPVTGVTRVMGGYGGYCTPLLVHVRTQPRRPRLRGYFRVFVTTHGHPCVWLEYATRVFFWRRSSLSRVLRNDPHWISCVSHKVLTVQ